MLVQRIRDPRQPRPVSDQFQPFHRSREFDVVGRRIAQRLEQTRRNQNSYKGATVFTVFIKRQGRGDDTPALRAGVPSPRSVCARELPAVEVGLTRQFAELTLNALGLFFVARRAKNQRQDTSKTGLAKLRPPGPGVALSASSGFCRRLARGCGNLTACLKFGNLLI